MSSVTRRVANWFALGWAAVVTAFLLFYPVYAGTSSSLGSGDVVPTRVDLPGRTLLAVNGLRMLWVIAIPLLVAAVPLVARNQMLNRRLSAVCAVLMIVLVFLGSASIGLLYLPTAIALTIAATSSRTESPSPA